jgi:hypothetical protein
MLLHKCVQLLQPLVPAPSGLSLDPSAPPPTFHVIQLLLQLLAQLATCFLLSAVAAPPAQRLTQKLILLLRQPSMLLHKLVQQAQPGILPQLWRAQPQQV